MVNDFTKGLKIRLIDALYPLSFSLTHFFLT